MSPGIEAVRSKGAIAFRDRRGLRSRLSFSPDTRYYSPLTIKWTQLDSNQ
ncbi:hypothetical protein [Coleofasciculus sp. E2-BRE-01]